MIGDNTEDFPSFILLMKPRLLDNEAQPQLHPVSITSRFPLAVSSHKRRVMSQLKGTLLRLGVYGLQVLNEVEGARGD